MLGDFSMAGMGNEPRLSGTAMGTLPERLRPGTGRLLETPFKKLPPIPKLDLEMLMPEVSHAPSPPFIPSTPTFPISPAPCLFLTHIFPPLFPGVFPGPP